MEDPQFYVDLFAPWSAVSIRKMFGGLGIYREGTIFAIVAEGGLYLKGGGAAGEKADSKPFTYERDGRTISMNYRLAPADLYEDEAILKKYADAALRAAVLSVKKPATRRQSRR